MKRFSKKTLIALTIFIAGAAAVSGYVRIQLGGKTLNWSSNNISWQFNSAGSDNVSDGSDEAAIQAAFAEWQSVNGSALRFSRGADTGSKNAGTSAHVIFFDENNGSGFFPSGSGIVAITPISYDTGNGRILDADIIFNGRDWNFSTDGTPGTYDIQDIATHEIGHFVGLDHSPVLSGTMWPYVSRGQTLHRSLTTDEQSGAKAIAPSGAINHLRGTLRKSNGSVARGALVAAVRASDGRLAATGLSTASGTFHIKALPAGDYFVYACPVEGAMTAANFTSSGAVDTDFAAAFYGSLPVPQSFHLSASSDLNCGTLNLPEDSSIRDSGGTAHSLESGTSRRITIQGHNLISGAMQAHSLSPYIQISQVSNGGSWVQLTVQVAADAPAGTYDIYLSTPSGSIEPVTGVLDITGAAPVLVSLSPPSGALAGGTEVTLSGQNFQQGCYVLFGGREALNVSVLNFTAIQLNAPVGDPGLCDVRVINPDGQDAVLQNAFQYEAVASYSASFPTAGQSAGGTLLLVNGAGFDNNIQVFLGDAEAQVEVQSSKLLRVSTPSHALGLVDLVLQNPGMAETRIVDAFKFVSASDPSISSFLPNHGKRSGGTSVTVKGFHLTGAKLVRFGVDPNTAQGGADGSGLQVNDDTEISVITPSSANAGQFGLMIELPSGQGAIVGGFTYDSTAPSSGGGGGDSGGGCGGVIMTGGEPDPMGDLLALAVLLAGYFGLRRRTRRLVTIKACRAHTS